MGSGKVPAMSTNPDLAGLIHTLISNLIVSDSSPSLPN